MTLLVLRINVLDLEASVLWWGHAGTLLPTGFGGELHCISILCQSAQRKTYESDNIWYFLLTQIKTFADLIANLSRMVSISERLFNIKLLTQGFRSNSIDICYMCELPVVCVMVYVGCRCHAFMLSSKSYMTSAKGQRLKVLPHGRRYPYCASPPFSAKPCA